MTTLRQNKVARLIQKELAEIFQREMRNAFGTGLVSVTHVFVSPDLSFAKTYLSIFAVADSKKVLAAINESKKEIRRFLGIRVKQQLRIVPEIAFLPDDSAEYAQHMEEVFQRIATPAEVGDTGVKKKKSPRKKSK